jgi:hypothetical protein
MEPEVVLAWIGVCFLGAAGLLFVIALGVALYQILLDTTDLGLRGTDKPDA